jgi:hypothetical protein
MKGGAGIKITLRDVFIISIIMIGLIVGFELFIRIFLPQDTSNSYLNNLSLGIEDELLGYRNRPNSVTQVKSPEFSVEYKINRDGLRDETPHLNPKPQENIRVLLLGDSFTFGHGNNYDKIWPVLVEQRLSKQFRNIEVVKAGVLGYDTHQELLYLERLFPIYTPDLVVVVFLPNDLVTNSPVASGPTDKSVVSNKSPKNTLDMMQSFLFWKRLLISNDRLYVHLKKGLVEYYASPMDEALKEKISITKELLLKISSYCKKNHAIFVVLSIPQHYQVIVKSNDYKLENLDVDNIDRIFSEFARENGFYWITTLPELARSYQETKEDLYFRHDGHLNSPGNYLVAEVFTKEFLGILNQNSSRLHTSMVPVSP